MFKTTAMIFSAMILLHGCASSPVNKNKPADVTSNPSGASVYVNNLKVGETPLRHNLFDAFPAGWKNSMYQAQGVLTVKMDNCKDFILQVSDSVLRKPIHAELKCSKLIAKPKKSPVVVTPTLHGNLEKRLKKLEMLYKKKVITKEEYKMNRQRILNEL